MYIKSVLIDWNKIDGRIHPCAYEETDSYQISSMFLNNREQFLVRLLEDGANE